MQILTDYLEKRSDFTEFCEKLNQLIASILKSENIKPHQISVRVKDYDSLKRKIENKDGKYLTLSEITDIVGIRIITYFDDEVDTIAEVIKHEFDIDIKNSIDKRKLDIDKFGYKSLHYVISLSKARNRLVEYKKFKDFKAEIQIRSILQHSWAEIEHDLGYKSQSSIPDFAKRNFYRISALLEVADVEFVNLKKLLTSYKEEIKTQIVSAPNQVKIDQDTIKEFIATDSQFKDLQNDLASSINQSINEFFGQLYIPIEVFNSYNITTIEELKTKLREYKTEILKYESIASADYSSIGKATVLFTLAELLLLENNDKEYYDNNLGEMRTFEEAREILMSLKK